MVYLYTWIASLGPFDINHKGIPNIVNAAVEGLVCVQRVPSTVAPKNHVLNSSF